jgi:hypothetical protein
MVADFVRRRGLLLLHRYIATACSLRTAYEIARHELVGFDYSERHCKTRSERWVALHRQQGSNRTTAYE